MNIFENKDYIDDVQYVANIELPWEKLSNKTILISGATGLIGSCLIDVLMEKNKHTDFNCRVVAIGRNEGKANKRFSYCNNSKFYTFIVWDINNYINIGESIDYILHFASNTHPLLYSTDPINTITTNVFGTFNMLDLACRCGAIRSAVASSNEIYGENRGDKEFFDEDYSGYINCNTLRAGYTESKRCSEAMCQAFIKQNKLDIVIPRFTRSYGPTMNMGDTKAISQFIMKAVKNEDIILKSSGNQYYSYQYVTDSVSGFLTVLLKGISGEAYNISDESSDITLKELAEFMASLNNKKVCFEIPDSVEATGYSVATKARLDGNKLRSLGWKPRYGILEGIDRTIKILKEI